MPTHQEKTKTTKEQFQALGLLPTDAIEWEMRYALTNKIIEVVQKQKPSVTAVAKKVNITGQDYQHPRGRFDGHLIRCTRENHSQFGGIWLK